MNAILDVFLGLASRKVRSQIYSYHSLSVEEHQSQQAYTSDDPTLLAASRRLTQLFNLGEEILFRCLKSLRCPEANLFTNSVGGESDIDCISYVQLSIGVIMNVNHSIEDETVQARNSGCGIT